MLPKLNERFNLRELSKKIGYLRDLFQGDPFMQIPPGGREGALAFKISRTSISIQFHKMLSCS